MRVYSCQGWAFDDGSDSGQIFYRTKAEALTEAREATAANDRIPDGSEATVMWHDVRSPVTHATVVALLNHTRCFPASGPVATVRQGRVVSEGRA